MQFATHYYLFIDWMGEGEALRGRGQEKGKGEGGGADEKVFGSRT